MTFEQATERLTKLARLNGGVLTAAGVENDPRLALADDDVVCAAARALEGTTNVFGTPRTSAGWFPFKELRFTALP